MGKVSWTVSADSELLERLKALAVKEERPQAYFLDKALRLYLDRWDSEAAKQLPLLMPAAGGANRKIRAKQALAKKRRK